MEHSSKVRTCLWFENKGEEAANFYTSLLPDSHVERVLKSNAMGATSVIEFTLSGVPYMILNAGPMFQHSPAASISVLTKDQNETDLLWDKLTADGGEESMCGWLTDKYGISWQIVPEQMLEMLWVDDQNAATRAKDAMMQMKKLDIAVIQAAFEGK